ncbi:MAG: hypothetical protein U9R54_02780, partial [Bacteroidota bacterium]|nr:hypothetical protein [Bacteroidota bacterium]
MKKSVIINTIIDIFVLLSAFLFMIWLKPGTRRVYLPNYLPSFLVFLGIWILISILTKKYFLHKSFTAWKSSIYLIAINLFMIAFGSLLMFAFHSVFYSRLIVFGTFIISTFFEIILLNINYYIYHAPDVQGNTDLIKNREIDNDNILSAEDLDIEINLTDSTAISIVKEAIINESCEEGFNFIHKYINIQNKNNILLSTLSQFSIDSLLNQKISNIVNFQRINDIRYINKFFEAVNKKLLIGGKFISCVETKDLRKKRILNKYPKILNYIYYFFDYILKRV